MKQLLSLFLLLLPCLAWAQYPSNGNQKITLGEQTSADGLIYRGVLADTGIITPLSDTSAYIILDTVNHRFYNYNRTTNVWSMAGVGSISSGLTGVLPVANGGTNTSTLTANKVMVGNGTSGVLTPTNLHWDNTNSRLGIGTSSPQNRLQINNTLDINPNTSLIGNNTISIFDTISSIIKLITISNVEALRYNIFNGLRARGSMESPTPPLSNDFITAILSNAYDGSATGGGTAGIFFIAEQNVALGVAPQRISFLTSETNNGGRTERLTVKATGRIGINMTTPSARLHIAAGTATASTAPLKFTSQGASLLNPVEAGAVEFNGTNLLFTPSATRYTVNHGLTGSATLNFPSTLTMLSADLTITVTGAADGDVVSLGVPNAAVNANTSYSAWVSAANTVTVRFNNYSSGTVDPASALFKVFVTK
jgi:hypothetical protein